MYENGYAFVKHIILESELSTHRTTLEVDD
jgi:hypothetical protein